MCGPALQQLISIDLFWIGPWVCGQEGHGLGWGVVARKVELPGKGGQAFWAWAWPCVSAPWTVGSCGASADGGRRPPCGEIGVMESQWP